MTGTPDKLFFKYGNDLCPITNLFDIFGEETDDPIMAAFLVAAHPDGRWFGAECKPSDIHRVKVN